MHKKIANKNPSMKQCVRFMLNSFQGIFYENNLLSDTILLFKSIYLVLRMFRYYNEKNKAKIKNVGAI